MIVKVDVSDLGDSERSQLAAHLTACRGRGSRESTLGAVVGDLAAQLGGNATAVSLNLTGLSGADLDGLSRLLRDYAMAPSRGRDGQPRKLRRPHPTLVQLADQIHSR